MVFNSLHFAIFFAVILSILYLIRGSVRGRNLFLIACGYYFYSWWDWRFLGLLWLTTILDFLAGLMVENALRPTKPGVAPNIRFAKQVVGVSLSINLIVLGFFKYFGFFADSLHDLFLKLGWNADLPTLHIILPVGISFYTFQSMSYVIDIYRGKLSCERSLLTYASFVAFFPPLVAGPIERAAHLLPQLREKSSMNWTNFSNGSYLILVGLFKKVVIADNIAHVVDTAFKQFPTDMNNFSLAPGGGTALIAIYAFAIQIYCDFSGYTDIARGVARCMGFELMRNFDLPYFSRNPSEFWHRWHISLSSWLRDYLYIPLGGNRKGPIRTYVNLMLTMLIGGLWHGAAWTFVGWGAYQGFLLCAHRFLKPWLDKVAPSKRFPSVIWHILSILFTFQLVCLGWLLFRADSLEHCAVILRSLTESMSITHLDNPLMMTFWFTAGILLVVQLIQAITGKSFIAKMLPGPVRAVVYAAAILTILVWGDTGGRTFIYFQF
jgi:D-alanyl-lipoteichoic acid acyltransferase DltB (MBOAT superfamily)